MTYYHLGELIHKQAQRYNNKMALKYQSADKKWHDLSWSGFSDKIMKTARAMAEIGIKPKDNIGIYAPNMEKYLMTEFAAYANKAVMVSLYATASPAQVNYIVNDAHIALLFVGEQFQYNNAYKVQRENTVLQRMIVLDHSVVLNAEDHTSLYFDDFLSLGDNSVSLALVNARLRQLNESDLATLIYTSGTTGEPKGVMLTHANYISAFTIHERRLPPLSEKDLSVSFLPLTHIFEKAWTYYCLSRGIAVAINKDPREITKTLRQVRPTLMSNVPRFWEKVYDGVKEQIDRAKGIKKWIYNDAVKTGRRHNIECLNRRKKPPLSNRLKFFLYRHTAFYIVKRVVGIDRGNFFPVAGAMLSDTVNEFMQSIDVRLIYGYGLSETTATVSCFPFRDFRIGTVGRVMPGLEVKIGADNEILVKGATVMSGYYNKPEATRAAFTDDGFFRTGDAGSLTDTQEIILTDRLKDLYKTSNGKYIAPQMIETRIAEDPYIEQVAVIADKRKFVSALIVPNIPLLEKYACQQGWVFRSAEELVALAEIQGYLFGKIEMLQSQFTSYEKIKRFTLLPQPFTEEAGELTGTLKLRRKVILEKYIDVIDAMYDCDPL